MEQALGEICKLETFMLILSKFLLNKNYKLNMEDGLVGTSSQLQNFKLNGELKIFDKVLECCYFELFIFRMDNFNL